MLELEIIKGFLVAIALGALIGLEREFSQARKKIRGFAGIRTFPLIALFGALAAYLSQMISPWFLFGALLSLAALITAAYCLSSSKHKLYGLTSSLAALIVFFIGVLSFHQKTTLAVVITLGVSLLLFARTFLHHFAEKIKRKELLDTLKFIIIAFVILPFLPNQGYGPYQVFNPFIIWLMVVFVSGISFVGYILMKWFGERGLEMTALFGGLVSSTAVTSSFASRSQKGTSHYPLVRGVILANTLMFVSILIEVFALNRALFLKMLLPFSFLILASLCLVYLLRRKAELAKHQKLELSSPFTLGPALKFGLFFALVLALAKLAEVYLPSQGVYLVSFFSGLANVDAITLSLAQLAKSSLPEVMAGKGILLAALTNMAAKGGIAYFFGSKEFGKKVLALFSVLILIGLGMVLLF